MNFTEIPSNNLVPMFMTEFDGSNAAKSGAMPWKNLLVGQPLTSKAPKMELVQIFSDEQADALYGAGSQLALMARAFRKNTKTMELWCLPVSDAESSVSANGTITLNVAGTSGATESGTIPLMIGGQSVSIAVAVGDKAAEIAAQIVSSVNAKVNLPVTASATEAEVTLTAKNKGTCGNDIDVRVCHFSGETLPSGIGITIVAMSGGAKDPSFEDLAVKSIIAGIWFNAIVIGVSDTVNVGYLKDELDERWTATVQQTGILYFSISDTQSAMVTKAGALNSQVIVMPSIPESPTTPWEIAAASAGAIAPIALNDPAVPLCNWPVKGVVAPKKTEQMTLAENNSLLSAGCALLVSGSDGTVYLKRIVTTYKTNAAGALDTSYRQAETVHTLSFLRWDWNNYMAGRYPHSKLADDGTDFGPGQIIMTPSLGKSEILGRYKYWIEKGLVQDFASFKANVIVIRDPDDDSALQFLIPADLVKQFFIGKSKIQFK